MKIFLCVLVSVMLLAGVVLFFMPQSAEAQPSKNAKDAAAEHKILLVYYSRTGDNYVSGNIVNLPVGNTAAVAEIIREKTGADVFEIKTVQPYPEDYHATTDVAQEELKRNARPEIQGGVENIDQYDTVILGYPNWWGTMPMAVFTFLEKHDLSGKVILPFCTHEGSGLGRSVKDLKKTLPETEVRRGLSIKGSRVFKKEPSISREVESWLAENL